MVVLCIFLMHIVYRICGDGTENGKGKEGFLLEPLAKIVISGAAGQRIPNLFFCWICKSRTEVSGTARLCM